MCPNPAAKPTHLLPRVLFQSYQDLEAQFVLHCPGGQHWPDRLVGRLTPVEELDMFKWDAWPVPIDTSIPKNIRLGTTRNQLQWRAVGGLLHCQTAKPDLEDTARRNLIDLRTVTWGCRFIGVWVIIAS